MIRDDFHRFNAHIVFLKAPLGRSGLIERRRANRSDGTVLFLLFVCAQKQALFPVSYCTNSHDDCVRWIYFCPFFSISMLSVVKQFNYNGRFHVNSPKKCSDKLDYYTTLKCASDFEVSLQNQVYKSEDNAEGLVKLIFFSNREKIGLARIHPPSIQFF